MLQAHFQGPATTSAHLAQTMTLLSLTCSELQEKIVSELANNPALELVDERRCPMCGKVLGNSGPCPVCSKPNAQNPDEAIIFVSPREDFYTSSSGISGAEIPEDPYPSESLDLPTFVLRQIAPELDPGDRLVTAYILTQLDEDGFLKTNPLEIAQYHQMPLSRIQNLIKRIQRCEPIGVCSFGPKEALLSQVEILSENMRIPPLTLTAIEQGLDHLCRHQYPELAQKLNVSVQQIKLVARFIKENLNPFPARSHWGDVRTPINAAPEVFHQPDIIVNHLNDHPENPLVVEIIMPIYGTLRVNALFKQALKTIGDEKSEDWKKDIEKATLLIKCLQQRNNTMRMLMEKLVNIQKEYIIKGDAFMKPITRAHIADLLDVHESTISRAVSEKTIQLPNKKIVPLAQFFDRSLSIRWLLKQMIEAEAHPLSDTDLREMLQDHGIDVARRTVAKYRALEGILPAHLRNSSKMMQAK